MGRIYLKKDIRRFWNMAGLPDVVGIDLCWVWGGCCFPKGYGRFLKGGKCVQAHRAAYEIAIGEIPDGLCVCHSCDNRTCVNPAHLWLGTYNDNNQDRVKKGRSTPVYGEHNPHCVLTNKDVAQMRTLYKTGIYTQKELGDLFGTHLSNVSRVVNYKLWPHVP
jgi:hypothetical protein